MLLPVPTVDNLAEFTGRPAATFTPFATEALLQATLMFGVATGLEVWPDDPDLRQIAMFAVMEMANKLVLEQPYAAVKAAPFQSESIGAYSYSKTYSLARATAVGAQASEDIGAGLFWWLTAMDLFQQDPVLLTAHGSVAVEHDGIVRGWDGRLRVEDPVEQWGRVDRPAYIRIS